ncbi:proline-specific peptidase [Mycena polygramma]|nr:proline-specific peptidase [Mycena polygramma]
MLGMRARPNQTLTFPGHDAQERHRYYLRRSPWVPVLQENCNLWRAQLYDHSRRSTYDAWYKVVGDLHGATSRRPLVALHGGPGAHSIPLVVYDQIGTGNSTHLPEKKGDTSFWTEQLFLDELDNLLTHLGTQDDYDLLGHSWGGMFGSRHAAGGPAGLKHLVLASTPASMNLWMEAQNALLTADKEKDAAVDVPKCYALHLCRLTPIPAPILEGFEWVGKDSTSNETMIGTSSFEATGTLKDWSMVADAHLIKIPTLLVNGLYDQAQDSVVEPFVRAIPHAKRVKFMESSHMAHFEEREKYMRVVGSFLVDKFEEA